MVDVFAGVVRLMKRDRAHHVREIAKLDAALAALGSNGPGPRRGTMSAAGRARIAAAQRARWAKAKRVK